MTDLDSDFEQAAVDIKGLSSRPDNEDLLELYALYKQGSEGDVSGERPGLFDFVAGAKFDAWKKLVGKSQDQAKQDYIEKVKRLLAKSS